MKATRDRHDELPSKLIVEQVLRIEDMRSGDIVSAGLSLLGSNVCV